MPQTLLALAAIVSFAYFALGRQQVDNDVERRAIALQIDLVAADLAESRMAAIYSYAWDEEDVDQSNSSDEAHRPLRSGPPTSGIGPDDRSGDPAPLETSPDLYDDVDDVDGMSTVESVEIGEGALRFQVTTTVGYAADDRPEEDSGGVATESKWVRVVVEELDSRRVRPARVELRNVLSRIDHNARASPASS